MQPGPSNGLTDVPGIRVGHAELTGAGALSGTTVVLAPPGGAMGGVDVRGAAPGTRETDLLDPRNTVSRVDAVVLTGGSAYGLAAADGVLARLEAAGRGFPVPGGVVPIVPAAVLFDLGRGGNFGSRPDAATGAAAYDAAAGGPVAQGPIAQGCVGAGAGAVAGGLKGGVGTASAVLAGGAVVAALVVVNAVGSPVDPGTGTLWGARFGLDGEFGELPRPDPAALRAAAAGARDGLRAGTATTLAVLATDLTLDPAGCGRLATVGHDGYARAIVPVHTVFDGDTVFALSTATRPAPDPAGLFALHAAAADVVARAVVHAMLAATSARGWTSYREA
jgi:L-aminopeptidase/D-esterase-like protein